MIAIRLILLGLIVAWWCAPGLALAEESIRISGHLLIRGDDRPDQVDTRIRVFETPLGGQPIDPEVEHLAQSVSSDGFLALAMPLPQAYAGVPLWLELDFRLNGENDWEMLAPRIEYLSLAHAERGRFAELAHSAAVSSIDSPAIADGSLSPTVFAPGAVQQRIDTGCPDGHVLRQIAEDASVTCTAIPPGPTGPSGPRGPIASPAGSFAICQWSSNDINGNFCSRWCGSAAVVSQSAAPCSAVSDGGNCSLSSATPGGCCACKVQ